MDPQLDQRLTAIEKQLSDTNKIVTKLHHGQIVARNRKLLYWGIIVVLSIISYYSIKPYLEQVKEAYGGANGVSDYSELLKTLNE